MRDLIVRKKNEIDTPDENHTEVRAINVEYSALEDAALTNVLSYIAQHLVLEYDLEKALSFEATYVLNIPKDIREGLRTGKLWLTEKTKTGEKLASVSHSVDGKKQFLKNLTVEERLMMDDAVLHNLTDGMHKIAIQQQMAAMAIELEDIHKTVGRIERGQKDDRFGKIKGAREQLRFAMNVKDEDKRNSLVLGAIQTLTEGIGVIQESLKTKLESYQAIPEKEFQIIWKMILYPGLYKKTRDKEFDEIQDYFSFYEQAVNLWACASLMVNEPDAMKEIFTSQKEFLSSIDCKSVQSIANLHPEIDLHEEWFCAPEAYIEDTAGQFEQLAEKDYDYVAIEMKGEELLEVLNNAKDE